MSRAFAPILARNGGGAIINVLSALSWVVLPGTGAYMARQASAPKVKPEDVVRTTLDALEAGKDEVLADDLSKRIKQGLSAECGVYLG